MECKCEQQVSKLNIILAVYFFLKCVLQIKYFCSKRAADRSEGRMQNKFLPLFVRSK